MFEKKHAALQAKHDKSVSKTVASHAKKTGAGKATKDGIPAKK
jgi:hypothetical protein